jgi:hypothetical protein
MHIVDASKQTAVSLVELPLEAVRIEVVPSHDREADKEKFHIIDMLVNPPEWTVDGVIIYMEWTPRVTIGLPSLESYNEYDLSMR